MSHRILPLLLVSAGCSDAGVTKFNAKPTASITSHSDGDTVREGYSVTLRGQVGDADSSLDALSLRWMVGGETVCEDATPDLEGITLCDHAFAPDIGDVSLQVSDAQGAGGVARVELTVEATDAPTAQITSPEPDGVYYSDQGISFIGFIDDGEDSVEDLTVTWETDELGVLDITTDISSDGTAEAYGRLTEGEHRVRLRVVDTTGKEAIDSEVITVGAPNSAPSCTLTAPADGSAGPEGDDVRFEAVVTDPDIPNDALSVSWSSSLDGSLYTGSPDTDGTVRFSSNALTVGTHVVTLMAEDDVGATCAVSAYFSVGTPPELSLDAPTDGDVFDVGDSVRFSGVVSDEQDQPTDLAISWVSDIDGTLSTSGADSTGAFSFRTSALSVGEHEITLTATDTDGLFTTRVIDITMNEPPVIGSIAISPDPVYNDDTVSCAAVASDSDGSTPSVAYTWTNGTTGATLSTSSSIDLSTVAVAPLDSLVCDVVATDSLGSSSSDSESISVSNRDPALSVALSPTAPTSVDTLSCVASASDDDGDTLTTTFSWTVDGAAVTASSTSGTTSTLAGVFAYGNVVDCGVTVSDGNGGSVSDSVSVTVTNAPPVVSSVSLTPTSIQTNDTLTVNATTSDPEGDSVSVTYDWVVDGSTVVSGSSDNTLDGATWFDRGQVVYAEVVATDGVNTTRAASSTITVDNTAPTAPTLSISPSSPSAGDSLTCIVDTPSTDEDGDSLTYTMVWTVDGVAYSAGGSGDTGIDTADPGWVGPSTTTWTDDTVDGADVGESETWVCTATPSDGTDAGTSGTASVTTASPAFSGTISMPAAGTVDGFSAGPWQSLNGGGRAVTRIILTQACENPKLALFQHATADNSIQGSYYITDASGTVLDATTFDTYQGCNDCWLGHSTRLAMTMSAGTYYYLGFQNGTGGDMSGPSIYQDAASRTIGVATFDDPRADKPGGTPRGLPTTTVSWQNRWQVDCQ